MKTSPLTYVFDFWVVECSLALLALKLGVSIDDNELEELTWKILLF